jgi:hypothetical protein
MDRSKLTKDVISKMSGYTWIKLGDITDDSAKLHISLVTKGDDASHFIPKIESLGGAIIDISENKVMITGNTDSLLGLAKADFVRHVELGAPMSGETSDA